jgi:hypothetical protein
VIPVFGTAAVLTAPPAPLLSAGYVPGNTLAAQHLNWVYYHLTKELNNLLVAGGISQSTVDDTQIVQAIRGMVPGDSTIGSQIRAITPTPYSYGTSQSPSAASLKGLIFWEVTAAGSTTQDFSLGASAAGVEIIVYNSGAGICTVKLSAAFLPQLASGQRQAWRWNGSVWDQSANNRIPVYTNGALGTIHIAGDTDFFLNNTTSLTLPPSSDGIPYGTLLTFRNVAGGFTTTINANSGQTIGVYGTNFVLGNADDYVVFKWFTALNQWGVMATNGPVQSSSQTASTTTSTTGAWTAIANGLSLGSLPPGIYDFELAVTFNQNDISGTLSVAVGNGTSPISEYVHAGLGPSGGFYPMKVSLRGYVLTAAATIQGLYYSNVSGDNIIYSSTHTIGKITARRIG